MRINVDVRGLDHMLRTQGLAPVPAAGAVWLTAGQAAGVLGVDTATLYRWCRAGKVPFRRLLGEGLRSEYRFLHADLWAFMAGPSFPAADREPPVPRRVRTGPPPVTRVGWVDVPDVLSQYE